MRLLPVMALLINVILLSNCTAESDFQAPEHTANFKKIALLLPLTGPLAGPGLAIKDGFMAAAEASLDANPISARYYDTAAADVSLLYQKALSEGADFIIGPLSKTDVIQVAALHHPVPTLLLNELQAPRPDNNTYHLSLSPTLEAKEVANKAFAAGLRKALIIAPKGPWGDEIIDAFAKSWQEEEAFVIDTLKFDNNPAELADLSELIRDFLQVSKEAAFGKPDKELALKPKRREDFDMIFLLAYPSKARQIMPLLKYYFAEKVPVYATSSVYSGQPNKMGDKDLEGIIFCDMPWVFHHQLKTNQNWPEQFNSYNRLYALGMDSYGVSQHLFLNAEKNVSRALVFGTFSKGMAKELA